MQVTIEQHELIVMQFMLEGRLQGIKDTIEKNWDDLNEDEREISNYATYDLYRKFGGVK